MKQKDTRPTKQHKEDSQRVWNQYQDLAERWFSDYSGFVDMVNKYGISYVEGFLYQQDTAEKKQTMPNY